MACFQRDARPLHPVVGCGLACLFMGVQGIPSKDALCSWMRACSVSGNVSQKKQDQTCKFASHWNPKAQVTVAEVKGIVKHDQVGISAADLLEHVIAHNADVDVPVHELADHISGSLEPDFQLRYLRSTSYRSASAHQGAH